MGCEVHPAGPISEKSDAFGPMTARLKMCSDASPPFAIPTNCGRFCVPTGSGGNDTFCAVKNTLGFGVELSWIATANASATGGDCWQLPQMDWKPLPGLPAVGKSDAVVWPATYICPAASVARPVATA